MSVRSFVITSSVTCAVGGYISCVAFPDLQSVPCLSYKRWVTGQYGLNIPSRHRSAPRTVRTEANPDVSAKAEEAQLVSRYLPHPHKVLVDEWPCPGCEHSITTWNSVKRLPALVRISSFGRHSVNRCQHPKWLKLSCRGVCASNPRPCNGHSYGGGS